jgi:predicted metal-dependent enzyme (double-stranded beta helix superfamily)
VVYQIGLKPNAEIRLHDHRDYNGVLLGLEGQANCRNFEFYERDDLPPRGESFLIREEASVLLSPGRVGTLARRRHNLHLVKAGPAGARLLDVFTFFSRGASSHWLKFDDTALPGKPDLFEVSWA